MFRKVSYIALCFTLLLTSNMVYAAIEGEDGNGLLTAGLYATCVAGCALAGWFSGGGATPACLALCVGITVAKPEEPNSLNPDDLIPNPMPPDPTPIPGPSL